MSENYLRKGQELLEKLGIKTKKITSHEDFINAKNLTAILIDKNKSK